MGTSSVTATIEQRPDSENALPSFTEWLRQKGGSLTLPVTIALLNLTFNVAKGLGNTGLPASFLQSSLFTHSLQAALIAVLIISVPKPFKSGNPEHQRAISALQDFRNAWLFTLLAWFALYVIFIIESVPLLQGTMPKVWMHVVQGAASCLSTIGFWRCFLTVSNPDQKGDPMKWIGIVLLFVSVDIVAGMAGNRQLDLFVDLAIGALSGVAMAFFVGRLESRLLRPPRWLLMALYCYATLQFGYGFLAVDFKQPILWEPLFFFIVLLLKILLALFVNWLVGTGNLLFYLRYMSELNTDYPERRATFLNEVAEHP
jgi:hypothetical protein